MQDAIGRPSPETSGDLRNVNLQIEAVALPPLPNVFDYAVAVTSENSYLLSAIDGSHVLHTITGVKDSAVPGLIRWADGWARHELTGESRPSFSSLYMIRLPDGRLQVADAGKRQWKFVDHGLGAVPASPFGMPQSISELRARRPL